MKLAHASCLVVTSALLGACSLATAQCTKDEFLASGFEFTDSTNNETFTPNYDGCYSAEAFNDDDLELGQYTIAANATGNTTGGPTFYASDNGGGLDEPIWFFAYVEEGTDVQIGDSFLCFDLDLNPAADTHPADVTNWGIALDESPSITSTVCEIVLTCGCDDDDDDESEDSVDAVDDDADAGETANSASIGLVSSSLFFVVLTGSFVWNGVMLM